ncbi:FAD-dependent monooxygenase [Lutibaculum baratangense]|uniref:2-octaprenyl-3-methyl-6-methoxy-1,4-benzoquinol hydroxylase n=1 Tax=Lutibaculum baratangense AMV1 TaxID=631454 RepID=V4RCR0_9HYPH|nr:FAD-dependent monooxygenase [Lutibaculum baratangense]ESR23916.1 2-octaprenyl-3-methyl-6-methoxy-1,4-benzoquinol hydroxylase [Lutibaculum baratangense AMV1]
MSAKSRQVPQADVMIAGAGLAGRVLALCLAEAAGRDLDIRLIDGAPGPGGHDDIRAYALTPGARQMFEMLGVWQRFEHEVQPAHELRIGDCRAEEIIRPILLNLQGDTEWGEPIAYFVEARHLVRAVEQACDEASIRPAYGRRIRGLERGPQSIGPLGEPQAARLLVGADGARSAVRRGAGIGAVEWPYEQSAVVAILKAEMPHEGAAVQHFLPSGPFAMLPLPEDRTGLVWTLPTKRAEAVMRLDAEARRQEIERAAGPEFGAIEVVEGPLSFPLSLVLARRYAAERVALIGDAAHRLHPLAGLGLNVGLRDAAALAEVVVEAARRGEDFGSLHVLERYARWRRPDAVAIAAATDGLNRLFAADWGPLRTLRDVGLSLVERAPRIKARLTQDADGRIVTPPRLFTGLPI